MLNRYNNTIHEKCFEKTLFGLIFMVINNTSRTATSINSHDTNIDDYFPGFEIN